MAQLVLFQRMAECDRECSQMGWSAAFPRETGPIYAWPPPPPSVSVPSFVLPGPDPDSHSEVKARAVAQHEDSERAVAFYEAQRREREEREFKEGREAIAREVADRNRRNGWPC
jgi:hypothetical protein